MSAVVPTSGPPGSRIRRRRRLAGTLRWLAAQETAPLANGSARARVADPVALQVQAIADEQRLDIQGADLPEQLARIVTTTPIPPEVCAVLAAILLPLLQLPAPAGPSLVVARNPNS